MKNNLYNNKNNNESSDLFLTEKEKLEMKANVLRFIEANPIKRKDEAPVFGVFALLERMKNSYSMAFVAVLLFVSGIAVASENSLPGDKLYTVKTSVNEEVLGWFSTTPEAKANWERKLIERRLNEVEKLVLNGNLDPEMRRQIGNLFRAHTNKVASNVEKLRSQNRREDALKISAELESSLRFHEKNLTRLSESNEDVEEVAIKVRGEILALSKVRIEEEEKDKRIAISAEKETKERTKEEASAKIEQAKISLEELKGLLGIKGENGEVEVELKSDEGVTVEKIDDPIDSMDSDDEVDELDEKVSHFDSLLALAEENFKKDNFRDAYIVANDLILEIEVFVKENLKNDDETSGADEAKSVQDPTSTNEIEKFQLRLRNRLR